MLIFEKEDFIDQNFCKWLIEFYQRYYDKIGMQQDDNLRFSLDLYTCCHFLKIDNKFNDSDPIKCVLSKLNTHIDFISPGSFINYAQLVRWPIGSYQPEHTDFDYHHYTSIIYLNDDFEGGQTIVNKNQIIPKAGKIVTFQGNIIPHQVLPIQNANRYTVAAWYKKIQTI